jgi:hypothetical protein
MSSLTPAVCSSSHRQQRSGPMHFGAAARHEVLLKGIGGDVGLTRLDRQNGKWRSLV